MVKRNTVYITYSHLQKYYVHTYSGKGVLNGTTSNFTEQDTNLQENCDIGNYSCAHVQLQWIDHNMCPGHIMQNIFVCVHACHCEFAYKFMQEPLEASITEFCCFDICL